MSTDATTTDTITPNFSRPWYRVRAGLYRAGVIRHDLGPTPVIIALEVEVGDEENSQRGDRGWWRSGHDTIALGYDSSSWDYRTARDAMAAAEKFAVNARIEPGLGLVY